MNPTNGSHDLTAPTRILLAYADTVDASALVPRLPSDRFEVISCPLTMPVDAWLDDIDPALIVVLPPEDGNELVEACRRVRGWTDRPVLVLSRAAEELTVTRALAAGVDEYLVLPIGDRELVARLDALLRRVQRNGGLAETRVVGGLVLSSADHSVERDGRKTFLSPIEFRLLACLASAPGKVLTHQTLMSRVWGAEYVDSRHYLRVYIRYLREKIEDDPNNPQLIVSEWGVGYRLQLPEPTGSAPAPARAPSYGAV